MQNPSDGKTYLFTDDGLHAAFAGPVDAIRAAIGLQQSLAGSRTLEGSPLTIRCGLHAGPCERRGNELYGVAVNRAARIMRAAHGGQILLSQEVANLAAGRLAPDVELLDLGPVRLPDLCRAERIYQVAAPGLRRDFPALRSLNDVPNNLPEALCSFVGRTREIGEVMKLLSATRLVTLLGMGGVGKTRLSLYVGAECIERHRDGVWLVELGPLHEGKRVLHAVAAALGVREEAGQTIEAAIAAHAAGRDMLVILDNCEHVLEGAAAAARQLLAAGPAVRVLATSREPLRIAREALYLLPGLAVPRTRKAVARDAAANYFSVRLFVDRARVCAPGFELTAGNARAIAAICRQLDGIPLAIELAAARAASMPLDAIAAGLRPHLDPGALDSHLLPRQRILRAVIDWSHELLGADERALFRRLAVFSGGWTLEAAAQVCGGEGLLERLAETSLVANGAGEPRYRMLETVRACAAERLAESGEVEALRDRHLQHFAAFATAARPGLAGPHQGEWLARIDAERENILAAHEWAGRRPGLAIAGLRLVNALKLYWMNRGLLHLGLKLTLEALRRPGAAAPDADRAQGLFNAGQIRYFMGRHAEARQCLEQSLAVARGLGDAYVATVLQPLGMAALGEGLLEQARACFEESVLLARASGDKRSIAGALNALAMFHRVEGRSPRSRQLYEDVVRLSREAGNGEVEAIGLLNLAMVSIDQGLDGDAPRMVEDALRIVENVGSAPASQGVLDVCAAIAALRGDWKRTARFYGAAQAQAARSGVRRDAADAMFLQPRIAAARANAGESPFTAEEREGAKCDLHQVLREASTWLQPSSLPPGPSESLTASR